MAKCKHDKCYADYVFTTDPIQRPWVCRKCGAEGVDFDEPSKPSEYDRLTGNRITYSPAFEPEQQA